MHDILKEAIKFLTYEAGEFVTDLGIVSSKIGLAFAFVETKIAEHDTRIAGIEAILRIINPDPVSPLVAQARDDDFYLDAAGRYLRKMGFRYSHGQLEALAKAMKDISENTGNEE